MVQLWDKNSKFLERLLYSTIWISKNSYDNFYFSVFSKSLKKFSESLISSHFLNCTLSFVFTRIDKDKTVLISFTNVESAIYNRNWPTAISDKIVLTDLNKEFLISHHQNFVLKHNLYTFSDSRCVLKK